VFGKYCIPDSEALKNATIQAFYENFEKYFDVSKITGYVSDVFAVWYVLCIAVGVAFVLGFVYMILLRCCASLMIFVTLFAILLCLGGGGVWLYFMKDNYEATTKNY
jgi:hypothetical protein